MGVNMPIDIGSNGKMQFIYQFSDVHPEVTVTLSPESSLDAVFEAFEGFLKAAGYQIGHIELVEEASAENTVS